MHLDIKLMGLFKVSLDGIDVIGFQSAKSRALLAYLAIESDRPHPREKLADLFWPNLSSKKGLRNLSQTIYDLRNILKDKGNTEPYLLICKDTVGFNLSSNCVIDTVEFINIIHTSDNHRHENVNECASCIEALQSAMEYYKGSFLEGFFLADNKDFDEWKLITRERIRHHAVKAAKILATYFTNEGDLKKAMIYARRWVELDPLDEASNQQLISLLLRCDQRSAAISQYQTYKQRLMSEFGLEPDSKTNAIFEKLHAGVPSTINYRNISVPITPLLGREQELSEIRTQIIHPDCRLLSLIGPGGIGKTRLALGVVEGLIDVFTDGIHVIGLESVDDHIYIVSSIADGLGLTLAENQDHRQQLRNYLREKKLLLVLDNFEQLISGANLLTDLLSEAPRLKIMVTSRQSINLQVEWVYRIEGLGVPESVNIDNVRSYGAIDLFTKRANQIYNRFNLEIDASYAIEICQLVEGNPLAIELATAWLRIIPIEKIVALLHTNLDILATSQADVPDKHRNIRIVFDQSLDLLTEDEQHIMRNLSVFRGSFTLEAAKMIAGASSLVMRSLVDKSMLQYLSSHRYQIHLLLRQFVEEKLLSDQQAEYSARLLHSCYFAEYIYELQSDLCSRKQFVAIGEIRKEIDNIRLGWEWAVKNWIEEIIRKYLDGLYMYHEMQGLHLDGLRTFAIICDREKVTNDKLYASITARLGSFYTTTKEYEEGAVLLETSLEFFKGLGELVEIGFCLYHLAYTYSNRGDYSNAIMLICESIDYLKQTEDKRSLALAMNRLGVYYGIKGDYEAAEKTLLESEEIAVEIGDRWLYANTLVNSANIALLEKNYWRASHIYAECLTIFLEIKDNFMAAITQLNQSIVAAELKDYDHATKLVQGSLEIFRHLGDTDNECLCLRQMGDVYLAMGKGQFARRYYLDALRRAKHISRIRLIDWLLLGIAKFYGYENRMDSSLGILSYILHDPSADYETRNEAESLLEEFRITIPENEYRDAMERGKLLIKDVGPSYLAKRIITNEDMADLRDLRSSAHSKID